ncbi:MAG: hypothetical protein R3F43_11395 [bacterium]
MSAPVLVADPEGWFMFWVSRSAGVSQLRAMHIRLDGVTMTLTPWAPAGSG